MAGFAAFWCVICFVLSRVMGWNALAQTYEARMPYIGDLMRFQSLEMRFRRGVPGHMRNSVNFGVDPFGFYLVPLWLFRCGFKPLWIPWSDIAVSRRKRWFVNYLEFTFKRAPDIEFLIYERPATELLTEAGQLKKIAN